MQSQFITSAPDVSRLPDHGRAEVGIVGRSNVGKSSLLGMVLGAPKSVRVSRTPGRTQLLNLFYLGDKLALVDLPGYGYAKLSKTQRAQMGNMCEGYIKKRRGLLGLILLLDARREVPSEADRALAQFAFEAKRSLLLVITKVDLLPKTKRLTQARRLEKAFGVQPGDALLASVKLGLGRQELIGRLKELAALGPVE